MSANHFWFGAVTPKSRFNTFGAKAPSAFDALQTVLAHDADHAFFIDPPASQFADFGGHAPTPVTAAVPALQRSDLHDKRLVVQ